MALPDQIRQQSEAIKALYEKPTTPPTSSDPAQPVGDDDVVPPIEPEANSTVEPVAPGSPPEQGDDPNSETFEQRWRSLQGIHNADLQRAQAREREDRERIERLERLLASIPTPTETRPPAPEPEERVEFVSERDRQEYGESIDVMRRVSQEEVASVAQRLSQLETQISHLISSINTNVVPTVQNVAQRQAETAQETFWRSIEQSAPNWKQINNDPDFHAWLLAVDPLTNTTRQSHLEQAQQSLNATRVVAFFNAFSDSTGKYKTNATAQPTRSAQATELERQVAPGRSRSANAPTSQTAPTYTPMQIKKFFDDVRTGKYKGRETERNRIERDIFAAQQDGRILANA